MCACVKVKELSLRRIALGVHGEPEELAEVAAFLASRKASHMTGAVVEVTGGLDM